MRPSQYLFNAAKKSGVAIPLELTPLFVVMGVAVSSATFFTYKKFAHDKSLRLARNPAQSAATSELLKSEPAAEAPAPAVEAPAPVAEPVAEKSE